MNRSITIKTLIFVMTALWLLTGVTAMAATEQAKQQAINDGLVWLISQQIVSGDEIYWSYGSDGTLATTAAVALAFIDEGFLPGDDVVIDGDSYGDVVGGAANYIFNRATFDSRFGVETAGYWRYAEDYNNDGVAGNDGGNDQAIYFECTPVATSRRLYTTGICTPVVFALGEAQGIFTVIDSGSAAVNGRTYAAVMQDIIDWFCFAQVEPSQGNQRGGWRYDANWGDSDNSTAQWGALPLLYSDAWGLPTPNYVYDELELWVNYIQNPNGGSGYSDPNGTVNVAKTGGLILELAAIGAEFTDPRVQNAISFIDSRWNDEVHTTWYGNLNNAYAMWAVYKGLEVYSQMDTFESLGEDVRYGFGMPAAPGGFEIGNFGDTIFSVGGDWYSHYCEYLVNLQNSDGSWTGAFNWTGNLATGWYINILNASPGGDIFTDPDIQITSTFEDECPYRDDTVTHDIRYWFGVPGYPDPAVPPAEDVMVLITLNQHMIFVSATGAYTYDPVDHTVAWDAGAVPDGDERFETIVTVLTSTVPYLTEMVTVAEISASNVPEDRWDVDESRVITCPPPPCVEVAWGEPEYDCTSLRIPISLAGTENHADIWGVDVIVNHDPAMLEGAYVDFTGTILEGLGWSWISNPPMPGEFRVGLMGTTPIPGDGVLIYLVFDVLDHSCGSCTDLVLDVLLNEGIPEVCDPIEPIEWCVPPGVVDGEVKYWYCCDPPSPRIPGTEVCLLDAAGAPIDCMDTDPAGAFSFEVCADECYTLVPNRPCGETAGISTLDAALCLRYFVMLDPLNDCLISPMEMWDGTYCPPDCVYPQQVAADVTGNGSIHSYDGAIILRYIVGHDVSEYLVGCWTFFCHERYFCMDNPFCCDLHEQCFVGVLYGDVTGNWPEEPVEGPARQSEAIISVACVDCEPGTTVEVPVMLEGADGFYGLEFKVLHDADLAGVVNVIPSDLAFGGLLEWSATDGQIHVAAARPMGYEGDGEFCRIVYQVADEPSGDQCCLDLTDAYADEDPEPLEMVDGGINFSLTGIPDGTMPEQYALYPAAPNPFNPMTKIAYDVPASGGHVRIQIYDVTGRVVRTLVDAEKSGGQHEAVWRGRTDGGERAASGIYFCRMEAPSYIVTKKLTMLQ